MFLLKDFIMQRYTKFIIRNAIQNILMKLILLFVSIGVIEFLRHTIELPNIYYKVLVGVGAFCCLGYFVFYYDSSNNKQRKYFLFLPDADFHSIPVYAGLFVLLRAFCGWSISLLSCLLLNIGLSLILFLVIPSLKQEPVEQSENSLKDIPIENKKADELGRTDFVDTVAKIIQSCEGTGNRLLLDGDWGSGKTSIVNCVEETIKSASGNLYHFAHVNPWSNETRDKFVGALLSVIDVFCKETQPSFAVSKVLFNNLLANIAGFSTGYLGFQFSQQKEDLDGEIKELSQKLAYKKEKLVLVIDDLDRLTKTQILEILSVIYLFSECHNIIFLLLANNMKVEEILVESKNACVENLTYKPYGATSYEKYLEKMCSNKIVLPEILSEFLKAACLRRVDKILANQNLAPFSEDEERSIPIGCFNNMRTIKRILQAFLNTLLQPKVKGEVYPFHLFLLTILSVQFPKVYVAIRDRAHMWEKSDNYLNWTEETLSEYKQYFESLLELYPDERENLIGIFFMLSPNYQSYLTHLGIRDKNMAEFVMSLRLLYPISGIENIDKAFYNSRYINRYFCMNFSSDILPDSILDKEFDDSLASLPVESGAKRVLAFIQRHKSRINSFFDYIFNKVPSLSHNVLLMILHALAMFIKGLKEEINLKKNTIEEMVQITNKEIFSQQEIIAVVEQIQSLCDKYLFYYKYRNKHDSNFIQSFLQKQLSSAEIVLQEGYQNDMLWFVFAWEHNFEDSLQPLRERTQALIKIVQQNEQYFWFLYGNNLLDQISEEVTWEPPLPVKDLLDITTVLLQRGNLVNKGGLERLHEYLKKKLESQQKK